MRRQYLDDRDEIFHPEELHYSLKIPVIVRKSGVTISNLSTSIAFWKDIRKVSSFRTSVSVPFLICLHLMSW